MTEKQKAFADEYLIDLNATRAYQAVYKTKKENVARANGSRLLTNANIKTYIEEQQKQLKNQKIADALEVMEYLSSVMRGEVKEVTMIVSDSDSDGDKKTVQKVIKDVRHTDRIKAAELLGKRYALFTDKVQLDGQIAVQIIDDI